MAKNRNFDSFGGCIPTFLPDKCARFHVYRGNVSPVRGEKPIFGPVSKNNTSIAVLCADLLVTKKTNKKYITLVRLQSARDPRSPQYLAW